MNEIAGWIAPTATMIAAMMTAANLGARITGWGFVVFTVGSICWSIIGLGSGQTNLLATNAFLTVVNLVGVWRWLGRQRAYEDGGKSAVRKSRRASGPTLFSATGVAGLPVHDRSGVKVGQAVEALLECHSGTVSYVVVAKGGVGGVSETLHAIERDAIHFNCDRLDLALSVKELEHLPALPDGCWPGAAPRASATVAQERWSS